MAIAMSDFSSGELAVIWLILLCFALLGITANGMIMYLFSSTKELRTPMNCLFLNLTVGDFIVSLFGTFISAMYTLSKTVMQQGVCEWYGFITFLGGVADALALTVIAVERYLTVARPFGIGGITRTRAGIGMAITWAVAAVVAGLPLVGLSSYTHEGAGTWCSIDWEEKNVLTDAYIYMIFIVSYFFPIALIIFAYTVVVMKIRAVAKTGASESSMKAQQAVTNQSIIMVVIFVVAWTPYAIVCLITAFGSGNPFSPKVAMMPPMFAKFSFCINPFIYVAMNKQFRAAFVKKILKGKDPFAKKTEDVRAKTDVSYAATIGKTEGETKAGEVGGATNKVVPAPEA